MILYYTANYVAPAEEVVERTNSPLRLIIFCVLVAILLIYCLIVDRKGKYKRGKAYAKVNLFLNVLNKRKDGYHNIQSVFDFINLYDVITIRKYYGFKLICNDDSLVNENNIIYKAYLKLKELYPQIKGVKVTLEKNIPTQAGLGGGSSDCAEFIRLMGELYNLPLNKKIINELCPSLGADVLPCYYGKTSLVNGIGDEVEVIKNKLEYYLVIIKPNFECSTKEMYDKLDKEKLVEKKTINKLVTALKEKDFDNFSKYLYNDFEKVVDIEEYKKDLLDNKAKNCLLCGSGSCIMGVFESIGDANAAYKNLQKKYTCCLCKNKTMD